MMASRRSALRDLTLTDWALIVIALAMLGQVIHLAEALLPIALVVIAVALIGRVGWNLGRRSRDTPPRA